MRTPSQRYGALAGSSVRERRFYIRIEPNPGTAADDLYISSNGDITIGASGTVLDARIISAKVSSQRLNPDEGRATIGSLTVELLDVGGSFTTAVRSALLTDGYGLRGKRVSVYNGFTDLAYDEFELEDTQIVESVRYQSGHSWSINCRDIQREMRKSIFDPVVMYLTQPLSETATTIEVNSSTGLVAVEHGTSYTDAPSATVAYVMIDDEIIRVPTAGIGATQLTSCVRGVLGTRAAAHTTDESAGSRRGKEVREVIYLELPVPKLAYALLTGVLFNQSGTLPDHWNLGMDASDDIRASEFQSIGSDLYVFSDDTLGMKERYILTGQEDGKRFIEREILRKYGLFMPVHTDGQLGLRRGQPVLSGSATVGEINDRFLIGDVEVRFDMTKIINDIEIAWNFIDDEPTRRLRIEDTASISQWGRAPLLEVSARGLAGSIHTDSRVRDLYESLRDRYSGPPIVANLTVQASLFLFEVGDVVRVRTTHVKDFTNTVTDTLDRAFEIQGVDKDLMSGRITYEVFGSSQKAGPLPPLESTTPLPDAYYTAAGTNIATLPGVTDGGSELVLPNGLSLTGNADVTNSAAIYYATKNVRVPSGNVVSYTQNVQLRIRGTLTIEGDLDGSGAGLTGVADTYDTNNFPATYGPDMTANLPALQGGQVGYFGSTQADGGIFDRVSQRSGSSTRYRAKIQSIPAPVTQGAVEAIPSLHLDWNGSVLSGLPTDLRGTSGGPGGIRYWEDYADANVDVNRGGTGGAGGAGLLVICRGMSFGASGRIDSSGGDGGAAAYNAGDERPAWSGGGAGGAPGATIIVLDGAAVATPILTSGTIIADYGDTPKPTGDYNQLPSAFVYNADTRFNDPSISGAFIREDRFSFYESAASGREAGIAAARYFFLLPDVAAEEDTDDVTLAQAQDISLGITEAYANRFDPLVTVLIATITENSTTAAYSHANIYSKLSTDSVWVFQGPAEPTLEFELPADGNTYDIRAVPVLINGAEAPDGAEQGQLVSDGAGVPAVVWNNNIARQAFSSEDWGDNSLSRWLEYIGESSDWPTAYSATTDLSVVASGAAGAGVGGYALRLGNNSGNDEWRGPICGQQNAVPIVTGKLYRVTFIIGRQVGSATFYGALMGLKGDVRNNNGQFVHTDGSTTASWSVMHYFAAAGASPSGWTRYTTYFTKDGVAYKATGGSINDPKVLHPDVEYVVPAIIVNYSGLAGIYDIDFVEITEVAGTDLGDIAVSQQPLAGANFVNPNFRIPMPGSLGRPAGWWRGTTDTDGDPSYLAGTGDVMRVPNDTYCCSTAMRLDPNTAYLVTVRAKGSTTMNASLYVLMQEYDSELDIAGGKYAVGANASGESATQDNTRARVISDVAGDNKFDVTTSYQTFVCDPYYPTSTAKWMSISIHDFNVAGDLHIDQVTIQPLPPVEAEGGSFTWWSNSSGTWPAGNPTLDITISFRRSGVVIATRVLRGTLNSSTGNITLSQISNTGEATSVTPTGSGSTTAYYTVTHTGSGHTVRATWASAALNSAGGSPSK